MRRLAIGIGIIALLLHPDESLGLLQRQGRVSGLLSSSFLLQQQQQQQRPTTITRFPRRSSSCYNHPSSSSPSSMSQLYASSSDIRVDDLVRSSSNSSFFNYNNTITTTTHLSDAAAWHRERRKQMLAKYGDQITPLERESSSQRIGIPLLLLTNFGLLALAMLSGSLSIPTVMALSIFPGSILSLWQLQILHDVLHGSFFEKGETTIFGQKKKDLQNKALFWGSMPSFFGYYLYLKMGHLTHHKNVGDPKIDLAQLFDSNSAEFEDGDFLFVAHRMKLKGDYGPKVPIPFTEGKKHFKMSISKSGFYFWKEGHPIQNATIFAFSFLYERLLLGINDLFVSLLGKNLFFPNKPANFQKDCTAYARAASILRLTLLLTTGWKSLLFLYLSETLWSIPPHPSCAMFVTNHGSGTSIGDYQKEQGCVPSSSTYAGQWYSVLTLGTNFHCEHHDFPTIPFHELYKLRMIAPEYYNQGSKDDLLHVMDKAFSRPEFYACIDAGLRPTTSTTN
jgi:fatty acid desaturase